jgi:hypothetical protein
MEEGASHHESHAWRISVQVVGVTDRDRHSNALAAAHLGCRLAETLRWLHDHIVRHARNRARCSGIQAVSGMGRKTRWTSVTRDRDRLKTPERRDQNRA